MQRRIIFFQSIKMFAIAKSVPPIHNYPIKFHDICNLSNFRYRKQRNLTNQKNGPTTNENGDFSGIFLVVVVNGIRDDDSGLPVEVISGMAARVQFIVGHCHSVH